MADKIGMISVGILTFLSTLTGALGITRYATNKHERDILLLEKRVNKSYENIKLALQEKQDKSNCSLNADYLRGDIARIEKIINKMDDKIDGLTVRVAKLNGGSNGRT